MLTIFLILLPLLAGIGLLTIKNDFFARKIALWSSIAIFVYTLFLVFCYYTGLGSLTVDWQWIPIFNAHFHLDIDGVSLIMILLSVGLLPFIILSQKKNVSQAGTFYALLYFSFSAILGVFTAFDSFLFYICWELSLIPIYFLIILWGEGENRKKVTLKFFLYTVLGSLFMLVGFAYIYVHSASQSLDISGMAGQHLSVFEQSWLFWFIFIAFAIKTPLFPFHTWMPATYTQAPMAVTMLLSAVMSKMGIYGFIRWLIPLVPQGTMQWSWLVILLAVIGVVYASFITLKQADMKTFLAYSSMAHTGIIVAGLFALNIQGAQGAVFQMLVHGINMVGLLYLVNIFELQTGTRIISQLGGIRSMAPRLASLFLLILLGSVALPLTNGFVGEFLLISGIFAFSPWMAAFAGLSIIMGAVYMLFLYQKVMLGTLGEKSTITDLKGAPFIALSIISFVVIALGVFPQPILDISELTVRNILQYLTF